MKSESPWRDESTLRDLYIGKELSIRKIADRLSCSHKTISKWLDRHGIGKREELDNNRDNSPYDDEELLRELHLEKELHLGQMAERLDCARSTVSRYCRKFGIEVRENYTQPQPKHERLTDAEWLRQQHHDNRLACHEIGEKLGVSADTVLRWLQKHNIERVWRHTSHPDLDNADKLQNWHVEEDLSTVDIGNMLDVHRTVVAYHLRKHGIGVRNIVKCGSDHPSWEGGYDNYYGPNWQTQREKALRRDNYQCVDCGITNEEHKTEFGRALTCHHVTPIREFRLQYDEPEWWERSNQLENLVTLCDPHHDKWEGIPLRPTRLD